MLICGLTKWRSSARRVCLYPDPVFHLLLTFSSAFVLFLTKIEPFLVGYTHLVYFGHYTNPRPKTRNYPLTNSFSNNPARCFKLFFDNLWNTEQLFSSKYVPVTIWLNFTNSCWINLFGYHSSFNYRNYVLSR